MVRRFVFSRLPKSIGTSGQSAIRSSVVMYGSMVMVVLIVSMVMVVTMVIPMIIYILHKEASSASMLFFLILSIYLLQQEIHNINTPGLFQETAMNHLIIYCVRFIFFLTRKEKKKYFCLLEILSVTYGKHYRYRVLGLKTMAGITGSGFSSALSLPCLSSNRQKPQLVKYFRYSRQYLTFLTFFFLLSRLREKDGRNQQWASCEARKGSHVVTFFVSYFVYKICPVFFLITWLTWFDASWRNKQDYPFYTRLFILLFKFSRYLNLWRFFN